MLSQLSRRHWRPPLIVQRRAGKMFDMIEQRVACRGRAVGIFIGDREGDRAMQGGGVYYRGMAVKWLFPALTPR